MVLHIRLGNPVSWWVLLLMTVTCARLRSAQLDIDAAQRNGVIRPLHGVNLGPLCYRGTVDLSDYHRELRVPLTRLHDVVWLNADAVDISTIFRDFHNDAARAESYDFAATDDYIRSITDIGSPIVYRLGESIEHTSRKYRVNPPPDMDKWAQICVGIIRHYNEGWANGFKLNMRYWEVWNEPDVRPAMWTGTEDQYLQLFATAAKVIKARFPSLKVGGPALGMTGDLRNGELTPARFFTNFLAHCRAQEVPLDFFSWHCYTDRPEDLPRRARGVRRVLDSYGYAKTESHLNEWNYLPRNDWKPLLKEGQGALRDQWFAEMGGVAGAAFIASTLMQLQDAPVDAANYYTGEIQGFGLFSFSGVPKKTYYAFDAFRQLLDTAVRLPVSCTGNLVACAGIDPERSRIGILVANFSRAEEVLSLTAHSLPWSGLVSGEVFVVDAEHNLGRIRAVQTQGAEFKLVETLRPESVWLVKLRQAEPSR